MRKIGIYVHLPFCLTKCKYCDFNSFVGKSEKQRDYLFALCKEIKQYSERCNGAVIDTIYIGGGTPSTMFAGAIQTILAEIRKNYKVLSDAEISIEANPNSVTQSSATEWKEAGINRVSVGLQTTNANALKTIGRSHSKKDFINAINVLHDVGFHNINADLMIGLPKQKSSDVKYAINLCHKLGCKHISCYALILEENTPLYIEVEKGIVKLPKEVKTLGMYNTAYKTLTDFGFNRYEVSNFAYHNFECTHNLNCWNLQEYLGFGAGAHGFIGNIRYSNVSSIEDYINLMESKSDAVATYEKRSSVDLYEECIMLGLRTTKGVEIAKLDCYLKDSFVTKYETAINKYKSMGYIIIDDGYIRVTDEGMMVLNQIILDLVM